MAQEPVERPEPQVLDLRGLYDIIFLFHPVAKQADLLSESGKLQLRAARGVFDPHLNSYVDQKYFNNREYFTIWQNELRIPTWFGVDFRAGYEFNRGDFLNPQMVVPPDQGLLYAGVSVPIGQGMIIDQRRNIIRQAQIFTQIADAERLLMLNNLLLNATRDYWDWMYQYNRFRLLQEGYDIAVIRYDAVRERIIQGDLAPIDSVEAVIEVQQRSQFLEQSRIDYQNSMLRLSNHLWGDEDTPLELTENVLPQETILDTALLNLAQLEQMILQAREFHPMLQNYRYRISQLEVERRYRTNLLLPRLVVNLNTLQRPIGFDPEGVTRENLINNYKIGATFSYPLLLRRQRNELKLTNLHIQNTEYELQQQSRELSNKIRSVYNEMVNFEGLMQTQETMVNNYHVLRDGEETRFRNGESSLFLINTRERQLVEAQVKYYEFRAKFALSITQLTWEAGTLAAERE